MKRIAQLFKNVTFVAALVALGLNIALPFVGLTGTAYAIAMWAIYLPVIALIVKTSDVFPQRPSAANWYSFRPMKYFAALAIETVLAFGLPLIGIASGTATWIMMVGIIIPIGIYFGVIELNQYCDHVNEDIARRVWGKDYVHRF